MKYSPPKDDAGHGRIASFAQVKRLKRKSIFNSRKGMKKTEKRICFSKAECIIPV